MARKNNSNNNNNATKRQSYSGYLIVTGTNQKDIGIFGVKRYTVWNLSIGESPDALPRLRIPQSNKSVKACTVVRTFL